MRIHIVTDVKIKEYDSHETGVYDISACVESNPKKRMKGLERIEEIWGQRFVMENGDEIIIGLSEKVEKVLGAPFKTIQNMQKEIDDLRGENVEYHNENYKLGTERNTLFEKLASIEDMPFMARLKFLFTKKINNIKK